MEDNKKKKKKHLLYSIFNPQGSGKGVEKMPEGPDNIKKCLTLLWRNITRLLYINLLMIFGNFPLFFGLFAIGFLRKQIFTAATSMFAPLYGAITHSASPVSAALFGVHGVQTTMYVNTTTTYIFYSLSALVILTFGLVNTGTTHLLRSIVRGDPVFFWHDFKGAIKRNFRQGLILGILDALIIAILIYDIAFWSGVSTLYFANLIILIIYLLMRFYMYLLLITFDLSIWKILKNSLIFSILGFGRNITAFIGILVLVFIEYMLLANIFPLGIIFPFVIFFSTCTFFGTFAAYPKIKQIMIDPYMKDKNEEAATEEK